MVSAVPRISLNARVQPAIGERLFNHVPGDAVLDAAHGIEELDLGEDLAVEVVDRRAEPYQRRPAGRVGDTVEYAKLVHGGGL